MSADEIDVWQITKGLGNFDDIQGPDVEAGTEVVRSSDYDFLADQLEELLGIVEQYRTLLQPLADIGNLLSGAGLTVPRGVR
jgi:hypothetical protein